MGTSGRLKDTICNGKQQGETQVKKKTGEST